MEPEGGETVIVWSLAYLTDENNQQDLLIAADNRGFMSVYDPT